jgi:uncharacterized membrane protein YfcA
MGKTATIMMMGKMVVPTIMERMATIHIDLQDLHRTRRKGGVPRPVSMALGMLIGTRVGAKMLKRTRKKRLKRKEVLPGQMR